MTRLYVHPLPVRVWHWVNAFGFVALILTGLQIRYRVFDALSLKAVIDVHNRIGFLLIANYGIWLVYYLFSDRICVYHPELSPRAQYRAMLRQLVYYGYGLFKGRPNPHHVGIYRKFNPLQSMTYQIVMILLVPLVLFSGVVLWDLQRFAGTVNLLGGPRVVSSLHVALCGVFVVFLFVHVYLTTLGRTAAEHVKAMLTGYEEVEIDSGGRALRSLKRIPPVSGNNLQLTLDIKLQEITEQAFGDRKGALVAIDPATGGILALVSNPTYDPNLFVDGITPDNWKELNEHPSKPMVNRAINGAYPPGSTFKPFMALAALEIGKRTPGQAISDPGFFNFGNHTFRDDKKGGHGSVDMHKSIVHSCDTYYYMLANDMGIDNIARFMGQLGLGQRTGVDLGRDDSGESKGVLPSQEWKKKRFKKPEQQKWYAGETISIGIGQGYNAYTPIQLAQATAVIANNGVMFRPHLVRNIIDARTGEGRPVEPHPIRDLKLKPQNVEVIRRAMVGVNKEGTGARAFAGASYAAAGKTGTAQVFSLKGAEYKASAIKKELRDHALFIAFAPADKPTIALAVLVENGGFGAQSAAPIARMVLDYYLLGKLPAGAAKEDPAAVEVEVDNEE